MSVYKVEVERKSLRLPSQSRKMALLSAIILCLTLTLTLCQTLAYDFVIERKIVTPGDVRDGILEFAKDGSRFETKFAKETRGVPPDNGGNYGDLVYRYRETNDRILLREVVINEVLSSTEQDIRWYVSISGARISSVRVLNFGRERAYCLRIDVAGGDVQVVLRIPPLYDPRVMIEVYGY